MAERNENEERKNAVPFIHFKLFIGNSSASQFILIKLHDFDSTVVDRNPIQLCHQSMCLSFIWFDFALISFHAVCVWMDLFEMRWNTRTFWKLYKSNQFGEIAYPKIIINRNPIWFWSVQINEIPFNVYFMLIAFSELKRCSVSAPSLSVCTWHVMMGFIFIQCQLDWAIDISEWFW